MHGVMHRTSAKSLESRWSVRHCDVHRQGEMHRPTREGDGPPVLVGVAHCAGDALLLHGEQSAVDAVAGVVGEDCEGEAVVSDGAGLADPAFGFGGHEVAFEGAGASGTQQPERSAGNWWHAPLASTAVSSSPSTVSSRTAATRAARSVIVVCGSAASMGAPLRAAVIGGNTQPLRATRRYHEALRDFFYERFISVVLLVENGCRRAGQGSHGVCSSHPDRSVAGRQR